MKSTKTAFIVTLALMVAATLFGSHRSLVRVRTEALKVFEQGEFGGGQGVKSDLERQHAVCANIYTVALRNMGEGSAALKSLSDARTGSNDPAAVARERRAALAVLDELGQMNGPGEQDRKYISNFYAELTSVEARLSHDPYNEMARQFNDRTLAAFPANVLRILTGVKPLPVYR